MDAVRVAAALDDFATTVTADFEVVDIVRQLVVAATQSLRVEGAGVVVPEQDDGTGLLRLAFSSAGPVEQLERLQEELQNGPCMESHRSGDVLNLGSIAVEGAWPVWQHQAAELGLHAVAALPLRARGRRWGVLDLYRREPIPFSQGELAAATALANLATSYLVVTEDRDIARRAQSALAQRAMYDDLTGLPVRWVFLEHLGHALERLRRAGGHVVVLFLDIDGLKYVNDTYGHGAGDRMLGAIVERLGGALRPEDVVARIGGDEFVVLVDVLEDPGDITDIVERVLAAIMVPLELDESHVVTPTASIGVAHTADPDIGSAALIAHADSAMYDAKRTAPGGYCLFDEDLYAVHRAAREERDQLAHELRRGLETGQLEVHYQPIVEVRDDRPAAERPPVYAVEALLRWNHPERGQVPAGSFIELAERSGLMPRIGDWVLQTACRQLAAWDATDGLQAPRHLYVNLSASELVEAGLSEHVQLVLAETGLSGTRLTIEITESQIISDTAGTAAVLDSLRAHGCHLAIDDFGTGYSSLSRLTEVPAEIIKIDQSFSHRVRDDASAAAVVSAVVTIGRRLGRTVIAEGVEDEETLLALRELGITHLQGYYLGRPASAEDVGVRLRA